MLTSKAQAPAKLILGGEHAVLHGCPALTTRIHWFTRIRIQRTPATSCGGWLYLPNGERQHWTARQLAQHAQEMTHRHHDWQHTPDTRIVRTLADLPLAVMAWFQHQRTPLPSADIHIESDIPIGRGLGSSASLILAMLQALAEATEEHWQPQALQQAATELEHLAHGRSSGLDVAAIAQSARLWWQGPHATHPLPDFSLPGYLIDTGAPTSSTADCVRHTRQRGQQLGGSSFWQTFTPLMHQLRQALTSQHRGEITSSVQQLHQRLCQLDVVPQPVQDFALNASRDYGWSGKLCGAGSLQGPGGGIFWLLADTPPEQLCQQWHFPYWSLSDLTNTEPAAP